MYEHVYDFALHAHQRGLFQYASSAVVALTLSFFIRSLSATKLENMHLNAMNMRFVQGCLRMFAVWATGIAFAKLSGIEVDSLWASMLTSSSVVVGLASQSVLKNFASGLMIIYSRPFEVGDKIKIGGITATVLAVGFFQTRLRDNNNQGIVMPNGKIVEGTVLNEECSFRRAGHQLRRVNTDFTIDSAADLLLAIEALEEAAKVMDAEMAKINADEAKKAFPTGTATIAEYYHKRYGRDLTADQAASKSCVVSRGQDPAAGLILQLQVYCDGTLITKVSSVSFIEGWKKLNAKNIKLCRPFSLNNQ